MLMRIDGDTVKHSRLIVFNYQQLTHVINNEKNVDGGWLEGWGREALHNVASVGKPVGLIICRTLFLIGFEVRQSLLHADEKSHLLLKQRWCLQVFLFILWNPQSCLYLLLTTSSVFLSAACQKRWVITLAQTEWAHMWDVVVLLVWVGQLQMETRVQFNDKPEDGRRALIMLLRKRACGGGAGNSGRSLSTHSGPVLLHPPALNTHIRLTSPLPNYSRSTI